MKIKCPSCKEYFESNNSKKYCNPKCRPSLKRRKSSLRGICYYCKKTSIGGGYINKLYYCDKHYYYHMRKNKSEWRLK